jgi:hypothetical protein
MLIATPAPRLGLLWEPFNLGARPGIRDAPFKHWFTYVCDENAPAFLGPMRDALAFRYRPGAEFSALRSPKDVGRMGRDLIRSVALRRDGAIALCKDPIAVFSAPWLADTFDMDVVVTIRHPAAMVASVMRLGWQHPFGDFLAQPLMMRDVLADHTDAIERFAHERHPILEQASLLWSLIYGRVLSYREQRPEWHFVRHEDMSIDPMAGFEKLYAALDLAWTPDVEAIVHDHTRSGNAVDVRDPADHRRDSRSAVHAWKRRLTGAEIDRIRSWTEPVASVFYDDSDWS